MPHLENPKTLSSNSQNENTLTATTCGVHDGTTIDALMQLVECVANNAPLFPELTEVRS